MLYFCAMVELGEVLDALRSKVVFFEAAGGNHGDTLIQLGSRLTLERYGIGTTPKAHAADAIVINGGGALGVEVWSAQLPGLYRFAQTFRDKPLVVLPSSFDFAGDHLARCFVGRTAPAFLLAREGYSYQRLAAQSFPSEVHVGLAPDMAFALRDSDFLNGLKAHDAARHILLVERFDREARQRQSAPRAEPLQRLAAGETGRQASGATKTARGRTTARIAGLKESRTLRALVPDGMKRFAKGVVHRRRVAASDLRATALARLYAEAPQFRGLRVLAQDVSSPVGFTFEQFLEMVTSAAVVITTRLHVGILAALLDKPTYLVGGRTVYPKLESVYAYSLAELPQVHLW